MDLMHDPMKAWRSRAVIEHGSTLARDSATRRNDQRALASIVRIPTSLHSWRRDLERERACAVERADEHAYGVGWSRTDELRGLEEAILLGRGEELTGGRRKPSIVSDAMEAVIGAVTLDGGMDAAVRLILGKIVQAVSLHYLSYLLELKKR